MLSCARLCLAFVIRPLSAVVSSSILQRIWTGTDAELRSAVLGVRIRSPFAVVSSILQRIWTGTDAELPGANTSVGSPDQSRRHWVDGGEADRQ